MYREYTENRQFILCKILACFAEVNIFISKLLIIGRYNLGLENIPVTCIIQIEGIQCCLKELSPQITSIIILS